MSDHVEARRVPSEPSAKPRTAPRLEGLDGTRGLAFLAIVGTHVAVHFTPQTMINAHLDLVLGHAVTFFFVLSAFLLYLPYVKRLNERRPMPPTRIYLRRRVFRIFPAYLVIFLLANFVLRAVYLQNPFTVGWASGDSGTGMMTDPLQLLANLTLAQSLFPDTLQTGNNPSWTLTTEWGFYLALPLIGIALFALVKKRDRPLRTALIPVMVLFALGLVTQAVVQILQKTHYPDSILEGYWGPNWTAVLSRSSLAFASVFALGLLGAVIYVALADGWLRSVPTIRLQAMLLGVIAVGLIGAVVLILVNPHYVETLVGVASVAFILLIVTPLARGQNSRLAKITDCLPLKALGVMALSTYLWHYPVLITVGRLSISIPDSFAGMFLAYGLVGGITVILGWLTYRFVEKPAMRFGEMTARQTPK